MATRRPDREHGAGGDPAVLPVGASQAASIGGSSRHGRPVGVSDMRPIGLVVTGCVAVSAGGARQGKGGRFSDLEYALAWEAGLIGPGAVVPTTVSLRERSGRSAP